MTTGRRQRYIGDAVEKNKKPIGKKGPSKPSLFSLLPPYRSLIFVLVVFTILGNALNLVVPKVIAHTIDAYGRPGFVLSRVLIEFFLVSVGIFVFAYLQSIVQTYAAEKIAKDLRTRLVAKISVQDNAFIQHSDAGQAAHESDVGRGCRQELRVPGHRVDDFFDIPDHRRRHSAAIHRLAAGACRVGHSSRYRQHVFGGLGKVRKLFRQGTGSHRLAEPVINESILGATLIRMLNSQRFESQNFSRRIPKPGISASASCACLPA